MYERQSKEEAEKNLKQQREDQLKVEELLGQNVTNLKEEVQHLKQSGEEARREAEEILASKMREMSAIEMKLQEETSLRKDMEAKSFEEKAELQTELEGKNIKLSQLSTEVSLKVELLASLEEKLDQERSLKEDALKKEQTNMEAERAVMEEKLQEDKDKLKSFEAELTKLSTSHEQKSHQLEQLLSDKEELDTKLQEEMEAKAHILSLKEKLEEEKVALTRSAEEQTSQHNLQLSQV